MRSLVFGLMLLVAGCGSNAGTPGNGSDGGGGSAGSGGGGSGGTGGSGGNGGGTGGNGSGDMSIANGADAGVAYGCNEILSCIAMCGGSTSKGCVSMCRSGATQTGRGLYQSLSGCFRATCYVHPDASMEPCTQNMTMPSAQCSQCLADAVKPAGSCANDPHCGSCDSEYAACAADK